MDTYDATAARVLALPTRRRGWDGETVADYLGKMLTAIWDSAFSSKYGFTGESDWTYDLYYPLITAGMIDGVTLSEEGLIPDEQERAWARHKNEADKLIAAAIREFIRRGKGAPGH